ncbi:MAG: heavy metal translocating P-type ATPase [Armatimonadota bacterium]
MVQTKVLDVPLILPNGYDCQRCVDRLRDSLLRVHGVQSVHVDFPAAKLTLAYDPNLVALETVERKAEEIGVELAETIAHHTFPLAGMDCPDCAMKIEKAVTKLPGVLSAQVSFAAARMVVEYNRNQLSPNDVVERVRSLGYGASLSDRSEEASTFWQRNKLALSTTASGAALLAGLAAEHLGASEAVVRSCLLLAMLSGACYMARSAVASLLSASFDTNFLMLLAAAGAVAIGQWTEAATVVFLFSLGNTLESYTAERARASIRSLMKLAPETAVVIRDSAHTEVPVSQVRVGDTVLVRPGSRVPVDGTVVSGTSVVDQSPITGESIPVEKAPGDQVFAGTINQAGALEVKVQRLAGDTTLARLIHLVQEAQAQKAPSQRFTERFGRIYTPTVIAVAVVLGLIVPLAVGGDFRAWFTRSLTLLVVACPCALVISTPVAVAAGIARAAGMGVLIKGGAVLERLGSLRAAAFDKTGTLTKGVPSVAEVVGFRGADSTHVLHAAAAVESYSEHPIASAVVAAARERGFSQLRAQEFRSVPGRGVTAKLGAVTYTVGSRRYLEEQGVDVSTADEVLRSWLASGRSAVLVASEGTLVGAIAIRDTVRPQSRVAVRDLKALGFRPIVMLTGDDDAIAAAVSAELGVDEYRAGLLPEHKVDAVNELIDHHGQVLMVGDGVNDAPALATATVGVAMGAAGTDAAIETADVALMSDDLTRIPDAVRLSRATLSIIRQNIAFSFAVVLLLVGTTLVSGLRLSLGVLGHEGSALLVILNGMRLLRYCGRPQHEHRRRG